VDSSRAHRDRIKANFVTMVARQESLSPATSIHEKLDELRTELVDLAFALERRGQFEAADVAITTSSRIGELCEELRVERIGNS
jgi:hypothetical protein